MPPHIPTVYITPYTISPPNQTEDMCLPAQTQPPTPVIATLANPAKSQTHAQRLFQRRLTANPFSMEPNCE